MRKAVVLLFSITILSFTLAACSPKASALESTDATPEITQPTQQARPETAADPFDIDPSKYSGDIVMAGSSTVYPVSEKMVEMFNDEGFQGMGNIKLDSIGSGAGFERFCVSGETDIANASRAIKDSEVEACKAINRNPIEFRIGTDALAIVTNKENSFVTNVTIDELAKLFSSDAKYWSDVNPAWPTEEIHRYVPGTDSGTYDFFVETVMVAVYGKETAEEKFLNASNYQASEDDNVLVQGVAGDPYAIGFFGFAFYNENEDTLNILSVAGVTPSFDTAESGEYPLSRPLYIYSDAGIIQAKPQVSTFIGFYLENVSGMIGEVGYFPASEAALNAAKESWLTASR